MATPARKKAQPARATILYRATPYQARAFARLRLEGMTVQGYLNALIENDLKMRTDEGWSPEYGGIQVAYERHRPRKLPAILR